jgi:hypothetical protein
MIDTREGGGWEEGRAKQTEEKSVGRGMGRDARFCQSLF